MMDEQSTTEQEVKPQSGPQWEFFCSEADIVIYGGQAGGGKSWALVTEPTRRVWNKGFRGGLFRRTYPQLKGQGGLWDESQELYRAMGAKMREGQELDATFPSGANIAFRHLQHEKTKYEYQGTQFCYLGFDELTHFTETQFFYMLSRNRSSCGIRPYVRATCNPDAGSWVADFISWWIDPQAGTPIAERSGVVRYFLRDGDVMHWSDDKQSLVDQFEGYEERDILGVTFIPATLDDNPALQRKDPAYRARLKALPRVERERLLGGNWLVSDGAIIESEWLRHYDIDNDKFQFLFQSHLYRVPISACRRIATIDTAGTSKEKAAVKRGDPPSWSACAIWDALPVYNYVLDGSRVVLFEMLFLRYVWRSQVEWNELKTDIPNVLQSWMVQKAYIENAHHGAPLSKEIRGVPTELIGPVIPGMKDSSEGAKLERAVASGMLTNMELGKIFVPREESSWLSAYKRELVTWTGLPKETADQIDVTSYACYKNRSKVGTWSGPVKQSGFGAR